MPQEPIGYVVARTTEYELTPFVTWGTGVRVLESARGDCAAANEWETTHNPGGDITWAVYAVTLLTEED